ncbi:MAG: TIGR04211 family SH3 domain-containing protein [Desulfobacterales bacterium]|nr:TIGR04211 family SH3 domain-containing protein [Desulfobacterales bacterium]
MNQNNLKVILKILIGSIFFVASILCNCYGQNDMMYIDDQKEITVRTGKGTEFKVIAMGKSGEKVEVLEFYENDWSKVKFPNGREGWVMSRFLTKQEPPSLSLKRLSESHNNLISKYETLQGQNNDVKSENKRLTDELEIKNMELADITSSYEALKSESSNYIKLKKQYDEVAKKLEENTKKAEMLESELENYYQNSNFRWFLSGAGLVFISFILGYLAKQPSRGRSSLLR